MEASQKHKECSNVDCCTVFEMSRSCWYGLERYATFHNPEIGPLTDGCQSCSKSPLLLRKYLDVVKYLCDAVMKELGLHWRNHFYEAILGTVLATAAESSRYQRHALQIPPATPSDNFNTSYNASTSTSTASAAMPPVVLHTATAYSLDSVLTSSAPSDDVSYCPDSSCKASFTGSRRKTNLTRHLKTALHHNQGTQLTCWVCQASFGRTDNLQQHVRNIHGLDPGFKSQE